MHFLMDYILGNGNYFSREIKYKRLKNELSPIIYLAADI